MIANIKIAIIGATGAVGRCMLRELLDSEIFQSHHVSISLFASKRSAGTELTAKGWRGIVQTYSTEALQGFHYALMSAGGEFSRQHSPQLAAMGVVVIDNSSAFRMNKDTLLVVPEVNSKLLQSLPQKEGAIIANPNCSTIQLMINVHPLEIKYGLEMLITSTYQSVSGSGQKGIKELSEQVNMTQGVVGPIKDEDHDYCTFYDKPIAFNLLPMIGENNQYGDTLEEEKMMYESQKILQRNDLIVMATAVRVPVFYCHGQTVVCKLKQSVSLDDITQTLKKSPGIKLSPQQDYPSPREVCGSRYTHISRIRVGGSESNRNQSQWVQMWNVADNLMKGAATNAVQILESCINYRTS